MYAPYLMFPTAYYSGDLGSGSRLALVDSQRTTQLLTHSPSSAGQGKKTGLKGSFFDTNRGRLHTSYCHGQNRCSLGSPDALP